MSFLQKSQCAITDIFEYCSKNVPKWNTISISGYHIREAGSTAVQEVAFTLSNALQYVESAIEKGLSVDDFACDYHSSLIVIMTSLKRQVNLGLQGLYGMN